MQILTSIILLTLLIIQVSLGSKNEAKRKIEKNLRNECLEYQHTQDDQVVCIKRLNEEQINQILNR